MYAKQASLMNAKSVQIHRWESLSSEYQDKDYPNYKTPNYIAFLRSLSEANKKTTGKFYQAFLGTDWIALAFETIDLHFLTMFFHYKNHFCQENELWKI